MKTCATPRVLHLHTLSVVSGSGLNTLATLARLRDHGFEAELACGGEGGLADLARKAGIRVHGIAHLDRPLRPLDDARALLEIASLLRRERFDVVHTHNSKAGLLGRLAARLCRVPALIHTVHGWAFEQSRSTARRALYRAAERGAAPLAHRTILVSEALETTAQTARVPGAAHREVLYSGIDLASFRRASRDVALRGKLGAGKGTFLVGQVAKLWEGKGHLALLRAFARLRERVPEARLAIVGDGPLRSAIERASVDLGVSHHVIFTGHRDDVARVTAQFDVATLLSDYEGMGRVVVEALAAGVPVVASRRGGIVELVNEGETGFLVNAADSEDVAGRLARLAGDPLLRERMAQRARISVDGRFDEHFMATRIAAIYRRVLVEARGRSRSRVWADWPHPAASAPGEPESCI